jgi:plastocyanin
MKSIFVALSVAVMISIFGPGASYLAAQDKATGSIKGQVTATGVHDVESIVVYVDQAPGDFPAPQDAAGMDQEKMSFVPHVLPILKGTKVKFNNSDPVLHNVFWNKSDDGAYAAKNLGTFGKGQNAEFTFDKVGSVVLLCNVHPEMEGHIVVLQNPFFAQVGKDGSYEIKGVPTGQYSIKAWYPNPKKLKSKTETATVTANQATKLDFSLGRK